MDIFDNPEFDHEKIVFFRDNDTRLKLIIPIHSTILGKTALGGLRMFPYKTEEEALLDALHLSRAMTYKAALANIELGGGKAVIIGDPKKDKTEKLLSAVATCLYGMRGTFVIGEDMGMNVFDMDYIDKVIGRLAADDPVYNDYPFVTGRASSNNGSGDPSLYTALGVFRGIQATLQFCFGNDSVYNKIFAIQGIGGHVGSSLAKLILAEGGRVVGSEIPENIPSAKIRFHQWGGRVEIIENPDTIYQKKMDVFCPCAKGEILNKNTIYDLFCAGCTFIAGSANNQLKDPRSDSKIIDQLGMLYVVDYVINAGGLIAVAEEYRARLERRAFSSGSVINRINKIRGTVSLLLKRSVNTSQPCNIIADTIAREKLLHAKTL